MSILVHEVQSHFDKGILFFHLLVDCIKGCGNKTWVRDDKKGDEVHRTCLSCFAKEFG